MFASGKETGVAADPQNRDSGGNLHTNFQLRAAGEYVALVRDDGTTIVSEFGPGGAEYPEQFPNISYGIDAQRRTTELLSAGGTGRVLIPTTGLPAGWSGDDPLFDDDPATRAAVSRPTDAPRLVRR